MKINNNDVHKKRYKNDRIITDMKQNKVNKF